MSKIKFVRAYMSYGETMAIIVYHSGYCRMCTLDDMPRTAADWIATHDKTTHYDPVFKRDETIYM